MDLSPGTTTRPAARRPGTTVTEPDHTPRIDSTIAFAFTGDLGLVLLFETVQPEVVLSFIVPAPHVVGATGGTR